MAMRIANRVVFLICIAVASAPLAGARAHPHAWIDLRSTIILDDQDRLEALELEWLFDEFYTAFIAEEFTEQGQPASDFLTDLARTNLAELEAYGYFTDVRFEGERIAVGPVEDFETGLTDQRLWLRFVLPLAEPVDPRQGSLTFAVYDPTFYIEILHLEGEPVAVRSAGGAGCAGHISAPEPNPEALSLAAALDRDESGGDELGALFAETVMVRCR